MTEKIETRCGYVTIFGQPNAGKSTLMNAILRMDLSIVNRKAQTTRNKILGILTEDNYQIIFFDTPGIIEPSYELQKFMMSEIRMSVEEADVVLHLIDVKKFKDSEFKTINEKYSQALEGKKRIIVLNKIDLVDSNATLPVIERMRDEYGFKDIIPISATEGFNISELKKLIVENLPVSPFLYDEETITDKPERFFVSEIIRQKILDLLHEEIPYSVFVDIVEFKEREHGKDYINAEIILERESQKVIFIGKNGATLKRIGQAARQEIERFLGREVFLELFVKVRKNWRKDGSFLKNKFNS